MSKDCKDEVYYTLENIISSFADDFSDAKAIADEVIDEVIEDVEACADEDFNDSDISIAFTRVLMKRLRIEK